MDPELQAEHDIQDEELPFEDFGDDESLEESTDEEGGINWEMWWQIIVHRNAGIQDPDLGEYPDEAWSLDEEDAPFPFGLEATWHCATILVVILAVHCELDTSWLLRHGYRSYLMRILSKTILTVAISFLSTLLFEVIGNVLDLIRGAFIDRIFIFINVWLIERLHWGPVNNQGRADLDGDIQFHPDPTHIRQPIRQFIIGTAVVFFNYLFTIFSYLLPMTIVTWIVFIVSFMSIDLANFLLNLSTNLALPTPGMDGTLDLKTLLWEFGPPIYIQLWAAALIYLCVFLFMSRAETPIILGEGQDPFSKLVFQLLRATSLHLLAYTAYQIVYIYVTVTQPSEHFSQRFDSLISDPVIRKIMVRFYLRDGILVLVAHWLVKSICKLLVQLCFPLWISYIVWLSIKTERATRRNWVVYGPLLNEDMEVLNPGKRVVDRAAMTAMFGLKSSWPSRMRLSTGREVD
ncbi:hypothetical protein F4781DRAFT_21500 [Annulohypoxylon bovei var. microspora]|nr:hypothetical protein F4781DRAFT_21500 [Annulohypoxylon bovei var. microspora]